MVNRSICCSNLCTGDMQQRVYIETLRELIGSAKLSYLKITKKAQVIESSNSSYLNNRLQYVGYEALKLYLP